MHLDRFPGAFIGACLLALSLCLPAHAGNDASSSAQARAQLDALRDKIDHVRQQIAADKSQRSGLSDTLARAEAEISAAAKKLSHLDDTIARQKQRVSRLIRRRDAERAQLADRLDGLRAQVRAAYENGRMDRMRLLLSGQSPEKLGRLLAYYEYFANAQTEQLGEMREALTDLAVRQRALTQEQQQLAGQREARRRTLSQLKTNQQQRRRTIAALDERLSSRKASLDDLKGDEHRLEKLLGSLQRQLAELPEPNNDHTPFARLKGRMTPPVAGPVIAHFGAPKAGGPLRWQGEWLAADEGTPVRAVAAGQVVYVGYMHRYGLIVVIDHGHDYYTLYGHAESAYVEVGDRVQRGQAVAKAGRSGGHRRSGTYFEIRKGRTPVNPARWMSG